MKLPVMLDSCNDAFISSVWPRPPSCSPAPCPWPRRPASIRRSFPACLAQHRSVPRRPHLGRDRRGRPAGRLLHGPAARRRLEDDERRRNLVSRLRRGERSLVGRRDRGRAVGSERHLRRHGRPRSPAAASTKATASTSPPTPARPGSTSGSTRRSRFRRSSSIRKNPNLVLVAAQGDIHTKTEQRGIFRSTDGGKTWKKTLYVDDTTGGQDLAWAYDQPNVMLAMTVRHYTDPNCAARRRSASGAPPARRTRRPRRRAAGPDRHVALQIHRRGPDVEGDHRQRPADAARRDACASRSR